MECYLKKIDKLLLKLKNITKTKNDKELCKVLDINYSTLDTWKNKDRIPDKRLFDIAQKLSIDFELLHDSNNFENSSIVVAQDFSNNSNAHHTQNINSTKKDELIPSSLIIEINALYERIQDKDDVFVKDITYQIEDFINDLKKKVRE